MPSPDEANAGGQCDVLIIDIESGVDTVLNIDKDIPVIHNNNKEEKNAVMDGNGKYLLFLF